MDAGVTGGMAGDDDMELTGTIENDIQSSQESEYVACGEDQGEADMSFTAAVDGIVPVSGRMSMADMELTHAFGNIESRPSMGTGESEMEMTTVVGGIQQHAARPSVGGAAEMDLTFAFGNIESAGKRDSLGSDLDLTVVVGGIEQQQDNTMNMSLEENSLEFMTPEGSQATHSSTPAKKENGSAKSTPRSSRSKNATPRSVTSRTSSRSAGSLRKLSQENRPGRSTPLKRDITADLLAPSSEEPSPIVAARHATPLAAICPIGTRSRSTTPQRSRSQAKESTPSTTIVASRESPKVRSVPASQESPSIHAAIARSPAVASANVASPQTPETAVAASPKRTPTPFNRSDKKRARDSTPRRESLRMTPERMRRMVSHSPTPPPKKILKEERMLFEESPAKSDRMLDSPTKRSDSVDNESFLESYPTGEQGMQDDNSYYLCQ